MDKVDQIFANACQGLEDLGIDLATCAPSAVHKHTLAEAAASTPGLLVFATGVIGARAAFDSFMKTLHKIESSLHAKHDGLPEGFDHEAHAMR